MATASQIADLITTGIRGPTGPEDVALYTGTILSWDTLTGLNSVLINGTAIPNLKSIQPGIAARYTVGDSVIVARKQTQYFILGKVAAPGGAAASAPAGNTVGTAVLQPDSAGAFIDLTGSPGPSVTTFIGSNKACLILWNFKYAGFQSTVEMAFETTGATNLAPAAFTAMSITAGFTSSVAPTQTQFQTASGFYLMGNTAMQAAGLTTFTSKYKVFHGTPGPTQAQVSQRSLTVIPL